MTCSHQSSTHAHSACECAHVCHWQRRCRSRWRTIKTLSVVSIDDEAIYFHFSVFPCFDCVDACVIAKLAVFVFNHRSNPPPSSANRMIDASREITFNLFTKQNVKVNILHSILKFIEICLRCSTGDSCALSTTDHYWLRKFHSIVFSRNFHSFAFELNFKVVIVIEAILRTYRQCKQLLGNWTVCRAHLHRLQAPRTR